MWSIYIEICLRDEKSMDLKVHERSNELLVRYMMCLL